MNNTEILKEFTDAYFAGGSAEKVLALLDENVSWIGTSLRKKALNKKEAELLLKADRSRAEFSAYSTGELSELKLGEGSLFTLLVHTEQENIPAAFRDIRLTVLVCGNIKSVHMSYPCVLQSGEEFLPSVDAMRFVGKNSKDVKAQYEEQMNYHKLACESCLAFVKINISTNAVSGFHGSEELGYSVKDGCTVDELCYIISKHISGADKASELRTRFDCESLSESFRAGRTSLSHKHRMVTRDGKVLGVEMRINMMINPESGDLEAYIYAFDMDAQLVKEDVIRRIVSFDYDFIILVDPSDRSYRTFADENKHLKNMFHGGTDFDQDIELMAQSAIADYDRERFGKDMCLKHILYELDKNPEYTDYFSIMEENGQISRKKYNVSALAGDCDLIMLTRSDVTELYNEEQRKNRLLADALTAAKQANVAKTEFLSRMSHEIRTPMNSIIGLSTIAAQESYNQRAVVDNLAKIGSSATTLLSLVNDVLEVSRIESGKMSLTNEEFGFREFFESACSIAEGQCSKKGLAFEAAVNGLVEPYYVGDVLKLQQVIMNIMGNAIKFTPEGGKVFFTAEQTLRQAGNASLRFVIEDTGIGISEKFLSLIFDPFSQEDVTITTEYDGSGLGLPICNSIISMMGGSINVESEKGKGSKFTVEVPLVIPQQAISDPEAYAPIEVRAKRKRDSEDYDFCDKRILLVEDHPLNIQVAKKLLEMKGAEVEVAINGQIAVDMFSCAPDGYYDAILMDVRMPVMDGLTASDKIRHTDTVDGPIIPIIAMTANAFKEDERNTLAHGMNAHLAKPIDPNLLYRTLQKYFEK